MEESALMSFVLPGAISIIMLSLGLSLTPADFRRVIEVPRAVAIGMANLVLVSPLLALAMAELFGLPALFAVGLVLLGASPGGAMSNMLTHLARGETALSVTMTALSSLTALLTVPIYLDLAASHFGAGELGDFSIAGVVIRVFSIAIVPIAVGMLVRGRWPQLVARHYRRVSRASFGLFLLVVAGAVVSETPSVLEHFTAVAGAALALNVIAMTLSFTAAKVARLDDRQATAIALELGIHNSALAIAVGASISTELAVPAAIYSAFMFVTAGVFARLVYRRNTRLAPADPLPGADEPERSETVAERG